MNLLSAISRWGCPKRKLQQPKLQEMERAIHNASERNKDVTFTVITAALNNVARQPDVKTVIDSVVRKVADDPAIQVAEDALAIARSSKRGR